MDREVRLSYPPELEVEIVEWILFERQNEIPLNINDVKEFALELIKTKCPKFKGSYNWIKKFLVRNNLSLRAPNQKAAQRYPRGWEKLANQFREEISSIIDREGIQPNYIINMDETPLFYEYLPLKVVEEKGKKNVATWKAGLEKKRCTVILAVTASGNY